MRSSLPSLPTAGSGGGRSSTADISRVARATAPRTQDPQDSVEHRCDEPSSFRCNAASIPFITGIAESLRRDLRGNRGVTHERNLHTTLPPK